MSGGRLFQSRLPAAVKARSPTCRVWCDQFAGIVYTRGVLEWLSAFPFFPIPISFIPISIPVPAKHLFPFPLFSHIDIPIPSHSQFSHSRSPYIKWLCGTIVTALCSISHSIVVLATQIYDTILTQFTVVLQNTETNHTMGLCVKAANKEHKV